MPATPTPIPAGTPIPLDIDTGGLWGVAPNVVGLWNQFEQYTPVLQLIVLGLLLLGLIGMIAFVVRSISEEEA